MARFRIFKKLLWSLDRKDLNIVSDLGFLANVHARQKESLLIFEILLRSVYACSPINYENFLRLMDWIFCFNKDDYLPHFGKHIIGIACHIFYKGGPRTKITLSLMLKRWVDKIVISEEYYKMIIEELNKISNLGTLIN